jgi:hypothetical protein
MTCQSNPYGTESEGGLKMAGTLRDVPAICPSKKRWRFLCTGGVACYDLGQSFELSG